jgi:hypothetical protein
LEPAHLGVDEVSLDDAFHVYGRLGGRAGSGTVEEIQPELTQEEHTMRCSSRVREWTVERRVPASAPEAGPTAFGEPAGAVHVRVSAIGRMRITRSVFGRIIR